MTVELAVLPGPWYDAAKFQPFLPGVYEVDEIQVTSMARVKRYSYFDGRGFKPADHTVDGAHALRFCSTYDQLHPVTCFRGLTKEV